MLGQVGQNQRNDHRADGGAQVIDDGLDTHGTHLADVLHRDHARYDR